MKNKINKLNQFAKTAQRLIYTRQTKKKVSADMTKLIKQVFQYVTIRVIVTDKTATATRANVRYTLDIKSNSVLAEHLLTNCKVKIARIDIINMLSHLKQNDSQNEKQSDESRFALQHLNNSFFNNEINNKLHLFANLKCDSESKKKQIVTSTSFDSKYAFFAVIRRASHIAIYRKKQVTDSDVKASVSKAVSKAVKKAKSKSKAKAKA